MDASDIINRADKLFGEIGLTINKEKCKTTENSDVEFVGYTFPRDKTQ